MNLTGRNSRKVRAQKLPATPDEEYEVVAGEHSRLSEQIEDLEGFIGEAPQIREQRRRETQVTLPPVEDASQPPAQVAALAEDGGPENLQSRLGRRHLAAIRRARRNNFLVFLLSAAAVAAFLYWVSLVVQ